MSYDGRLSDPPAMHLLPVQFSLRAILIFTFAAAVLFWLLRGHDAWFQVLAVSYALVGCGQIMLGCLIRRSLRASGEAKTDRRESFDLMWVGCLYSLPMLLAFVAALLAFKVDTWSGGEWDSRGVGRVVGLFWLILLVPGSVANLSAVMVYFRPLRDWPLALFWLLNLAHAIIASVAFLWQLNSAL